MRSTRTIALAIALLATSAILHAYAQAAGASGSTAGQSIAGQSATGTSPGSSLAGQASPPGTNSLGNSPTGAANSLSTSTDLVPRRNKRVHVAMVTSNTYQNGVNGNVNSDTVVNNGTAATPPLVIQGQTSLLGGSAATGRNVPSNAPGTATNPIPTGPH